MKIQVTNRAVHFLAAHYICARINSAAGTFKLGLPTGSTVEKMYTLLCQLAHENKVDFSRTVTFNMDEYVGLPPTDPNSYYAYMDRYFFHAVTPLRRHQLNGCAANLHDECARYESVILQEKGIDLFVGGVGRNGHIAFNEPNTPFSATTHVVELDESTRQANARFFNGDIHRVPTRALTVGIDTILRAHELLFLATGASKKEAVAALEKEVSPKIPLTALKCHPRATLLLDEQAAEGFCGPLAAQLETQRAKNPQAECWTLYTEEPYVDY